MKFQKRSGTGSGSTCAYLMPHDNASQGPRVPSEVSLPRPAFPQPSQLPSSRHVLSFLENTSKHACDDNMYIHTVVLPGTGSLLLPPYM